MTWTVFPVSACATTVLCLGVLKWMDAPHLIAATLLVLALDLVARRLTPRPRPTRRGRGEPPKVTRSGTLRHAVRGIILSLLAMVPLAIGHHAALSLPTVYAAYLDRDRYAVERQAGRLEEAGQWLAAADLLAERRARPASAAWIAALAQRECLDLVQAAAETPDAKTAHALLLRAKEVAASAGVRTPMIDALCGKLELVTQLAASRNEQQSSADELRSLRDQRATETRETTTKVRALAEALQSAFISCGDEPQLPPSHRRAYYQKALNVAKAHSLDSSVAESKLRDIAELLAMLAPMALPPGSTVQIVGSSADLCPSLLVIDLRVRNAEGKAIDGLSLKDFQATASGTNLKPVVLTTLKPSAEPVQLGVLVDHSESTKGIPLASAKEGLADMFKTLQGAAVAKVIGFSTTVTPLTDWTADFATIGPQFAGLRSQGNTALLQAVQHAVAELQLRPGPRAIVLFTDGRDTIGGPAPSQLAAACKEAGIVVHAVALDTAETDKPMLAELARATGGTLTTTAQATELGDHFRGVAERLAEPFYRIVMLGDTAGQSVELRVGDAQVVTIPTTTAANKR